MTVDKHNRDILETMVSGRGVKIDTARIGPCFRPGSIIIGPK